MEVLDRNKVMRDSRHALTGLARFTDDFDLGNLRDRALRASVLAFFLPPQCKWMPFEFRAACTRCADLRTHQDELMSTNTTASGVRQCEQPDDEIANQNGEEKEEQLTQAIEHSMSEAIEKEEQDVFRAIMFSKPDAPVSSDGVIVMRLNKLGSYTEVMTTLTKSDHLSGPISRVIDAGCEVRPSWTPALLLVPLTQALVEELGMELRPHHIVAREKDKDLVVAALKEIRSKIRPSVVAPPTSLARAHSDKCKLAQMVENSTDDFIDLVVERTFLHYPIEKDISEASAFTLSAPCGSSSANQPENPRRWNVSQ